MLPGLDAQDAKCISLQNSHVGQPFGWKWDRLTRISLAQVCGSLMLRVGPVEMHQHDAADMEEKSESLQRMKIIWAAFLWVFSAKMQSKQCSACALMATSHDVLTVRTKQMGNEAQARRGGQRESSCMTCRQPTATNRQHNRNEPPKESQAGGAAKDESARRRRLRR